MAERMRFVLTGDDNLSPVLNRAGDSSARLHRRLADDSQASSRALRVFTRDANGNLRDLEGRFVSVAHASRLIRDENGRWRDLNGRFIANATAAQRMATVTAGLPPALRTAGQAANTTGGQMRDAQGRFLRAGGALGTLGDAATDAGDKLGKGGGGLSGVMGGLAAAAGLSLLPALGALVPMMAGLGLAAGTVKLGFSGVGGAMEAQTKGTKEYNEALKKLSPEARDFTKSLVGMKKEFSGVGKDVQKAMLPGFTKAVESAGPLVKILGRNMTDLGGTFGKAAESAGRVFKESGFQKDLQANLTLGKQFVGDMMSGFGGLGRSLLDFGAKSKPTLTSLSGGIRDVLGKGLPGMFSGLERGIGGSAKFLDGMFSMINRLLPAIGRFSGEVARALGPLLGQAMENAGMSGANAMDALGRGVKALTPVFKDLGYGLKSVQQIAQIIGPTLKDVGAGLVGAFLPSFDRVDQARGPLQRLSIAIQENKGQIQEFSRIGGTAILDFTGYVIQSLPSVIAAFRLMSTGILVSLDGIVSGAAHSLGWIPGIGPKLKAANKAFDSFKDGYLESLQTAEDKASSFAASTVPKLSAGVLQLNINSWKSQIETAKAKLKTVPPSKRAALLAKIDDLQNKVNRAKGQLSSIKDKTAAVKGRDQASGIIRAVRAQLLGLRDRTINVRTTYSTAGSVSGGRSVHDMVGATGGLFTGAGFKRGYAGGGPVRGPGTGTSDDVLAPWLSNGEFVMKTAAVQKYGERFMQFINEGRLNLGGLASGGMAGAGVDTARGLAVGMGASTGLVDAAARQMAAAVVTGIKTELQISSPSKRTKALAADVGKGLISGMTGSRDKIKSTSKDLAKDIWSAFTGSKDNRLVAYVNRQTKTLLTLAGKRDSIAATIKRAKDFAETTRVGAKQSASLGGMFDSQEDVTASGISAKLQARLAKMKTFSSYIKSLAKRGLNKTMLREMLTMGPEEGYAYASALAGSSSKLFADINSTQYKINAQAESLGKSGADALYDSGKNAGKGYLKGLDSQQDAIEKQMVKIAKGMDKAIRKALGIKSPSTVMAKLGAYSTQGLARGLVDGMPVLDQALGAVSGRVAATSPVMGRAAVSAGGGGPVFNIQVDVHDAMDPVAVAREVERVLLRYGRGQGGTISLKSGR